MSENELLSQTVLPYINENTPFLRGLENRSDTVEEKIFQVVNILEEHHGKLTRVEEIILFAKNINAKKIGLAYCKELIAETQRLADILEMQGFQTYMITCKSALTSHTSCNPIKQAKAINKLHTQLNITIGLCIGNDALFTKHAKALTSCFITKDRVLGHNPLMGLYMSNAFDAKKLL